MRLNEEESHEFNDPEGEKEMLLIKRFLESEHRYQLVIRLKAIECKENFFCYLSSTTSLVFRLFYLRSLKT